MAAIQRMIDNKMAPITQQQTQASNNSRLDSARRQRLTFLEDNQEANSNLDVLSEMLQAQPGLSLHSAYTKMIRWAHENRLDWTQSLKQQIALRHAAAAYPSAADTATDTSRPIPGRGVQPALATPVGNGAVTAIQ